MFRVIIQAIGHDVDHIAILRDLERRYFPGDNRLRRCSDGYELALDPLRADYLVDELRQRSEEAPFMPFRETLAMRDSTEELPLDFPQCGHPGPLDPVEATG